jgi:N-acetylglucosaminyldiphosphoundecaprenol N-acetyl-beta-D-mannosaminyltransferase
VRADLPSIEISGVPVARVTPRRALDAIVDLAGSAPPVMVAHVNVHTLNLAVADDSYRELLRSADLVLNDGKGIMLGARLLRTPFPADLNGNFFSPLLLELAGARGWPVYFLGAKPGVAERAAEIVAGRIPGLTVAGARDGYFAPEEEEEVAAAISASGAKVVLVGLGNPRQERWLRRWLGSTGAVVGSGVGAFFDFQTGEVARAPEWMNRMGLEWVHRLAKEPRRMWHRYLVGNPRFLWRVAREKRASRASLPR